MKLEKMSMVALLLIAQNTSVCGVHDRYVPKAASSCDRPTSCPKDVVQELEHVASGPSEQYKRNKEILHAAGGKEALLIDDLKELMEVAKQEGDFETHAEAYYRLKIELDTEDGGGTIVVRLKDIGIPCLVSSMVVGALSAALTHYYHRTGSHGASYNTKMDFEL